MADSSLPIASIHPDNPPADPIRAAGSSSTSTGPKQLPIHLFTRHGPALQIPQSTYFIPSTWRRYQLSELINKVLGNTPENARQPVPFEFLVNGEVLRGSLEAWVRRNRGGDEEGRVEVEYVRSMMAPEEVGRVEQEDWVSGLSLARPGYILLSSYLSHARVLPLSSISSPSAPSSNTGLYTLPLPTSLGATSCTWLSPPSTSSNILLAAGGVDRSTHIFSLSSLEPDIAASENNTARELYTLMGHTSPISSLASSSDGRELVSASWDGSLNLYILPEEEPTEHQVDKEPTSYLPGQKKRRKMAEDRGPIEGWTDGDSVGREEGGWRRTPDLKMRGHKGRVGGVMWDAEERRRVWSGGWDGSVRLWELESGGCEVVRQGPSDKAILSIDQWKENGRIATGSMDRTVSLWDTREATSVISQTLSLASPVPSLSCNPTSAFTLSLVTYSGTVQIWDVRSAKHALFTLAKTPREGKQRDVTKNGKRLGERLLAVDWDGETIVAGGEDGEVGVWRGVR